MIGSIVGGIEAVVGDVAFALLPFVFFFLIFQVAYLKLPASYVARLLKGVLLTFVGMIIYLQGINIAFIPTGEAIGTFLGEFDRRWLLLPFGCMVGFLATFAEPAVRVLCYQIENSSSGFIRGSLILYTLSVGGAVAVCLGMARIVYGIPFSSIILSGYGISLLLLVVSDKDFIAIAFDSGGVATGPMAVSFLASMAVGATAIMGGRDPIADAFGLIALIALSPILSVLILGTLYRLKKVHVSDA